MPQFTGDKFGFGSPNAAGDSGPQPFEATGGTKITSGDYTYHVFCTDHPSPEKTFTATSGTRSAELLIVGGGGGTAYDNGGGAGGGGVAHVPAITLSPGSIAVVIGAASPYATNRAVNFPWKGNDSTFAHPFGTITAKGGGCPGAQNATGPYEINGESQDGGSGAGGRRTNPGANNAYKANASSGIQPTQNPSYPVTVNNYGNDGGIAESGGAQWWFGGGGGTLFQPVFDWVKDNNIEPEGMIFFTDLCPSDEYPPEPAYPVLWVSTEADAEAPFGKTTYLLH